MHNDPSAKEAADRIDKAVDLTLEDGKVLPHDIGGNSNQRGQRRDSTKDTKLLTGLHFLFFVSEKRFQNISHSRRI
jgi:hypothetical protein